MGRGITGNAYPSRGRWFARVSLGGGKRISRAMPWCSNRIDADRRAALIANVVRKLVDSDHASYAEASVKLFAEITTAEDLAQRIQDIEKLCGGKIVLPAPRSSGLVGSTFAEVRGALSSGKLHADYPDVVGAMGKDHAKDFERKALQYIEPVIGTKSIESFTLDDALDVMRRIPEAWAKRGEKRAQAAAPSSSTRRRVAQVMHRVLEVAVFPLRLIPANPLPTGFMPKVGPGRARGFLHADEEAKLLALADSDSPLVERLLVGVLTREGMRKEEAASLQWGEGRANAAGWVDLKRGWVHLDDHKTVEKSGARDWPLDPGVLEALLRWRQLRPATRLVFDRGDGRAVNVGHLADRLRTSVEKAGVARPELLETTATRRRLNAHDLRGVFITTAIAQGKSEGWIQRRTGHTTSAMLARYRRRAENLAEGGAVALRPLHLAIPELAAVVLVAANSPPIATGNGGAGSSRAAATSRESPMFFEQCEGGDLNPEALSGASTSSKEIARNRAESTELLGGGPMNVPTLPACAASSPPIGWSRLAEAVRDAVARGDLALAERLIAACRAGGNLERGARGN